LIDDFLILGISQTNDLNIIKAAYRKRVKEIHPDIDNEKSSLNKHLLFIQVNQAYERIIGNASNIEKKVIVGINTSNGLVNSKDPAYAYYKTAIRYFQKIHPSSWTKKYNDNIDELDEGKKPEILHLVSDLLKLFPKAYYYFSIVVHDYPNSPWYSDSYEKMGIIEKRTMMYKNILNSFNTWSSVEKDKWNRIDKIIEKTKNMIENDGHRFEWPK
jgi:DnaJ domain